MAYLPIPRRRPSLEDGELIEPARDLVLGFGHGTALDHVLLDENTASGRVTLSVGTGRFKHFRAHAVVSLDEAGFWHWDGRYRFGRSDDD